MPRTLVVLVNLALILLCLGLGASPAGAQMPDASQPPVDPALTAILSDAAAALGWEERPTSSSTGAEVAHSTPGDPCASPVSGNHVAPGDTVVYVALGVGEAPAAPEGSLTHAQVNLHGVVADLVLARPADDPPPEGWGDAAWAAHLTWPMGGQRLGALVETNCPLGVRVEEEIVPLAEALFAAARAHGWQADPDALLSSAAGSTVAPPAPTAAPDLLIEWQPRHLAALGESAELLITPLDEEGQPSPNQPVTITRVEPPGISVEGVTGEAGSLRCSIAHDVADAEFYRYAVRAGDVERVVEIPVVGVRFILEGNPISGGAYRGVA
ncbi:MAG: hypothetical protein GX649_00750, partial [Chloroflexi bacterium]|nr:hypothetical protein [Chloroflexota bacterium]